MSEAQVDMETEMNCLLWEVEKAAAAVDAVASMVVECSDTSPWDTNTDGRFHSTLWLCQELAKYQLSLIGRLEEGVGVLHGRKAFIKPLENISSLSESMGASKQIED